MNKKYKIGDRILHFGEIGIIIKPPTLYDKTTNENILYNYGKNNRYFIKLYECFNVSETQVQKWISCDDIELDVRYYRDLKLKKLL